MLSSVQKVHVHILEHVFTSLHQLHIRVVEYPLGVAQECPASYCKTHPNLSRPVGSWAFWLVNTEVTWEQTTHTWCPLISGTIQRARQQILETQVNSPWNKNEAICSERKVGIC